RSGLGGCSRMLPEGPGRLPRRLRGRVGWTVAICSSSALSEAPPPRSRYARQITAGSIWVAASWPCFSSSAKEVSMNDHEALLAIQELMDGVEWSPDTLDEIASVMRRAGYRIRDTDGIDPEEIKEWEGDRG